jgi:hypothetical protein
MAQAQNINYLNKDFSSFKQKLIDYSKTYFPTSYNDFTPSSIGNIFIEMSAYVGDVLSFYLDTQIQETFIQYAKQKENLFNLAYMLGYRPKVTTAATVDIDIYQIVPSIISSSQYIPDFNYALLIDKNTVVKSNLTNGGTFLIQDNVDFTFSSSYDSTEISVYQITANNPDYYLLKKTRKAISATINSTPVVFNNPEQFQTIEINSSNVIGVLDVIDSNNNEWFEVPYLAQEIIFDSIKNTNINDPNFNIYNADTPYLLKLKKIQKRFATRFLNENTLQLQFGSGVTSNDNEEIIPNPDNIGIGLSFGQSKMTTAYSPTNILYTNTYGVSPSNTTLTIRYLTGGGVESNVPSGIITTIQSANINFQKSNLNAITAQTVFDSVEINNPIAASGGKDGDTAEEIKLNSLNSFQSQLRGVTSDDYTIRALSMTPKYGSVAKIYTEAQKINNLELGEIPSVLEMYILGYDGNKKLTNTSKALKQNLSNYLAQYRMTNDSIKIKDAFIINIGVDFEIIVLPDFVNNEVLLECIEVLKDYFNIDKWSINQPILLRNLYVLLDKVEGVQTVKNISISNKTGVINGYSPYAYDIAGATLNNVVYPSLDPCIWEVKFPNTDINGKVSPL